MIFRENPAFLLAILFAVFILYATSIPFDLTTDPQVISKSTATIRWIPFHRAAGVRESIPDVASNILLFIPLGILLTYAGLRAKRPVSKWLVLSIAILASAALSAAVETLQLLSPTRISSITDLMTNTIGAVCGSIISLVFFRWAREPLTACSRRSAIRSPELILLVAYIALMLISAVAPFDISLDVGSIKQGLKSARLDPLTDPTPWFKMLGTFIWFAGLCYLLCHVLVAYVRRLRKPSGIMLSLFISLLLACGLELAQIFISSRMMTTRDILAGFAGALYGCVLFSLLNLSFLLGRTPPPRGLLRGRVIYGLVLAHYLAFLAHTALYPYTFHLPASLWATIKPMLLPFSSYYGKTNALALFDFLGGIARFAPLGFMAQGHGLSSGKARKWPAVAICLVAGIVLEGAQLAVAGRYADSSDVIAAGCGGYLGVVLWRWWWEKRGMARGGE